MPVAISAISDNWHDSKRQHIVGILTFSGSYVTGGEVLSFVNSAIKSTKPPSVVNIKGSAGFSFEWQRSTGKLLVRSGATEATAGAYPAGLTADVTEIYAIFKVA